ncbi:hypothetical protein [Brachyspira pulli]|uniref:hypothetical protein n=1 Tax=Brachyspira pulli TaxID=310721 RepID=UPI003004BACC
MFALIKSVLDRIKKRPFVKAETVGKEVIEAQVLQPSGFTSVPTKDKRAFIANINTNYKVILAFEDLIDEGLKEGEACVYSTDDGGNIKAKIKLLKDGSIELEGEKIKLNGDSLGGLIKIEELKKELEKNNQILQIILQVCSIPVNEAGNGSSSVFQQALNAALQGKTIGNFNNIENDKVLHG